MTISLCHIDEIPESKAKGFDLPNGKVFAVKKHGKVYIYLNRCPHLGIQLEWQRNQFLDPESQYIQCSSHGALFIKETGECILGPCLGHSLWQLEHQLIDNKITIEEEELPAKPSPD